MLIENSVFVNNNPFKLKVNTNCLKYISLLYIICIHNLIYEQMSTNQSSLVILKPTKKTEYMYKKMRE